MSLGLFPIGLTGVATSTVSTDPSTGHVETTNSTSQFGSMPFRHDLFEARGQDAFELSLSVGGLDTPWGAC